jgi:outer membrane immunogenic protein
MQLRIKYTLALLLILIAVSACPLAAQDSTRPASAVEKSPRAELALGYSYLYSNAPPGGCGCFSLNGGNATFAWMLKPSHFALVGDIAVAHAGNIDTTGEGLTLSTFTVGGRYLPRPHRSALQPFGQVLVGVAHASESLVQGGSAGPANANAAFAANLGGGIDLRATRHFAIRLVEAEYLVTTFDNGVNDHQNILRINAGIVFRFGSK